MKKQRVETYLDPATIDAVIDLAEEREQSSSAVIRDAVEKELQRALDEGIDS
jgi:predicted transcriptional regulator